MYTVCKCIYVIFLPNLISAHRGGASVHGTDDILFHCYFSCVLLLFHILLP